MSPFLVGVDVGGTNLRAIRCRPNGRIEARARRETRAKEGWDAVAAGIADLAAAVSGGRRPAAVGVCVPASVDALSGVVAGRCKIPGGPDYPLARALKRLFASSPLRDSPIAIENDANAAAWGEFTFGAGRGCQSLLAITLGTGVGGGFVLDGRLYRGPDGSAGETGHLVVRPEGRKCPCGRRGCLEAYGGARALVRTAQGIAATPADLARHARKGSKKALAAFRLYGAALGIASATLVNLLNPDRIVFTGGIAQSFRFFAPVIREEVERRALRRAGLRVRIVRGLLGDDAGALGAATLAGEAFPP